MSKPSRAALNPAALAERLGIAEWQVVRAHRDGILPQKDRSVGWSADLSDRIVAEHAGKTTELVDRIGRIPDGGVYETAKHLAAALGLDRPLAGDTVRELERLGCIKSRVKADGWSSFDGRSVEAFTRSESFAAIVAGADVTGRSMMADDVAAELRVRRSDVDHLVRSGLLKPMRVGLTGHVSKSKDPGLPLYRAGDVAALFVGSGIDWDAVRATPKGHRSPLAKLPDAERAR